METQLTSELERQIAEALPRWLERQPALRQRVQKALQQDTETLHFDSFEEFMEWVDEDTSAEWKNGKVIFMSPASMHHQLLVGFLHHIIDLFVQKHQMGKLLAAPFKMKLENYGPEPDLLFIHTSRLDQVRENYLDGPADLVVGVISPESIGRDRGDKFTAYEAAGIPEYWLIDPLRQRVEFYVLDEEARYRLVPLGENGRFHSTVLPGLWVQESWFWADPLPDVFAVLKSLEII